MMLLNRMFPTTTFEDVRREMDRVMSSFTRPSFGRAPGSRCYPPVNVWEDGESYFVEAEVPGVDLNDIELQVVGNEVTIKGKRDAPSDETAAFHRRERGSGCFGRAVTLPTDVNTEKVEAVLKSGVLTITLPKADVARAKKITVTTK